MAQGEKKNKREKELSYDPAVLLLGMYPKELKSGSWRYNCILMFIVAIFIIAKKKELVSISRWINRENVVSTYNGILFTLKKKKEILPFVMSWINLEGIMLSDINQRTNTTWYHLYEDSKIIKYTEAGSRMVVASGYGQRETGRCWSEDTNCNYTQWISLRDPLYS